MPARMASDLAQLARLAREGGLDLRQVALRVKADLLLTAANPSQEDMEAFRDMALALIPVIDEPTAVILARKLASWPRTAPDILLALRARGGDVLTALIRHGMPLAPAECEDIAASGDADARLALSQRRDLTATASVMLAGLGQRAVSLALAANGHSPLPRPALDLLVAQATNDPALALQLLARPDIPASELTPLFLLAGPERQQAMIEAATAHEALSPSPRPAGMTEEQFAALIDTARNDRDGAISALAAAFGAGADFAAALGADPSRQLAALALIGLGVHPEDATRFLIGLGDDAARSVTRIFALVSLMRAVTPAVARRIAVQIGGLVARQPGKPAILQPAMDPSGTPARPGAERPGNRPGVTDILRRLGRQVG